ncbi:hypothetical protein Aperf_G00000003882 [Anoplocephala perfoliata]
MTLVELLIHWRPNLGTPTEPWQWRLLLKCSQRNSLTEVIVCRTKVCVLQRETGGVARKFALQSSGRGKNAEYYQQNYMHALISVCLQAYLPYAIQVCAPPVPTFHREAQNPSVLVSDEVRRLQPIVDLSDPTCPVAGSATMSLAHRSRSPRPDHL